MLLEPRQPLSDRCRRNERDRVKKDEQAAYSCLRGSQLCICYILLVLRPLSLLGLETFILMLKVPLEGCSC